MTVCIAALCTWAPPAQLMIVGSSDRLLTAGDIEFEPPQQKIYQFSRHIIALISGDAQAQISICDATRAHFSTSAPSSVNELADVFAENLAIYRRRQAEYTFLKPLNLDQESFLSRQNELSPQLATALANDLLNSRIEVETIIAGADNSGYHIFVVLDPGIVKCSDSVGFAAIGIGQRHAESAFMLSRYSRQWQYQRALLLTYAAKKRAEVAPGIGVWTDFFFIGAEGFQALHGDISKEIETAFLEMDAKIRDNLEAAGARVDKSIPDIIARIVRERAAAPAPAAGIDASASSPAQTAGADAGADAAASSPAQAAEAEPAEPGAAKDDEVPTRTQRRSPGKSV